MNKIFKIQSSKYIVSGSAEEGYCDSKDILSLCCAINI